MGALTLAGVAEAAAAGDCLAWEELVRRFDPVLRRALRRFRLSGADVDDVVQTTWLRAYAHLGKLDNPRAIGRWMMVVARHEAIRTLQRGVHEVMTDEPPTPLVVDSPTPETIALRRERTQVLATAVRRLSGRQREVMGALLRTSHGTYQDVSAELGIPIGSIGPTRDRALAQLRHDRELMDLMS